MLSSDVFMQVLPQHEPLEEKRGNSKLWQKLKLENNNTIMMNPRLSHIDLQLILSFLNSLSALCVLRRGPY